MYANMLQVTAIFAGFSGVAFAVYVGLGSRSVRQIKSRAGAPLLRVWLAALVTPWVCAIVLVFCGITDSGKRGSENIARWIALAALLVVVLQMIRIAWVFYEIAVIDLGPSQTVAAVADKPVQVVQRRAR